MTAAICLSCGARKRGALVRCQACGFKPTGHEEWAKSLMLSSQFSDRGMLEFAESELRSGKVLDFDEAQLRSVIGMIESGPSQEEVFDEWREESARTGKRLRRLLAVACLVAALGLIGWWLAR